MASHPTTVPTVSPVPTPLPNCAAMVARTATMAAQFLVKPVPVVSWLGGRVRVQVAIISRRRLRCRIASSGSSAASVSPKWIWRSITRTMIAACLYAA